MMTHPTTPPTKRLPRALLGLSALALLAMHLTTSLALHASGDEGAARPTTASLAHAPQEHLRQLNERLLASARVEIARYEAYHGQLPGELDDLLRQGFIQAPLTDAWGQPMRYFLHGEQRYLLFSAGPDGLPLTADDQGDDASRLTP